MRASTVAFTGLEHFHLIYSAVGNAATGGLAKGDVVFWLVIGVLVAYIMVCSTS